MHSYSAVLFDFDGTLAYTAQDVWDSVRHGFAVGGLTVPEDYASDDRNLAFCAADMVQQLYPEFPKADAQRIDDAVTHHYRYESTYPHTRLYPGIQKLLELLHGMGTPTGILSNKGHPSLARILKLKNWEPYFTSFRGTLDSSALVLNKVQRLAAYSRTFDMTDGVYIGDSAGDVEAAKANNIFSIGVLYGDGDKDALIHSYPDVLCEAPGDLFAFFMKG